MKDGEADSLPVVQMGRDDYLAIEQVARLSEAQLRWQAVTQQACLSRTTGLLCFNWDRRVVYKDGRPVKKKIDVRYQDNQLLVPLRFILSPEFQSFSGSKISWDAERQEIVQDLPVSVSLPPVERLPDRYRLSLKIPPNLVYHLIEKSPRRVWIRFVRGRSSGSQVLEGDKVIREIRLNQRRHSADLILKLGPAATGNDVFVENGRKKLVVDVFTSAEPRWEPAPAPDETESAVPAIKKPGLRTIVVDAGHGGMDAGAIGPRGTFEKDINLRAANELARLLKRERGVRVILTRDRDEFVPLNRRADIANAANADLFVSIHCNSSLSSKSVGFEVYFLSPEATDRTAEGLARIENSVVALETKAKGGSSRLNELLASMAVYNFLNESSKFAAIICRGVKNKSNVDRTTVKEADFHVLRGAQMPSVLVELEYLSNPIAELKLRSSRYRGQLLRGVVDGILAYSRQLRQTQEAKAFER